MRFSIPVVLTTMAVIWYQPSQHQVAASRPTAFGTTSVNHLSNLDLFGKKKLEDETAGVKTMSLSRSSGALKRSLYKNQHERLHLRKSLHSSKKVRMGIGARRIENQDSKANFYFVSDFE